MQHIHDFSDDRNKAWCIHCGAVIASQGCSRDHVPSRSLLLEPYPPNLPCILVCQSCNESFSFDEEYFVAFLGSVLSGSTNPADQVHARSARILSRSEKLRARIEAAKVQHQSNGATQLFWKPEVDRIKRIILKNARGHAFYELGEPLLREPDQIWMAPLSILTASERFHFERSEWDGLLPEVGSRMLERVFSGHDLVDGWIHVQRDVYRYMIVQGTKTLVRSVIAEYLATEVAWDMDA